MIALYPTIKPDIALTALKDACITDNSYSEHFKNAICEFTELIFKESFITFQGTAYISKEGIPTGNCISRQMVDCTMHWLIFKTIRNQINNWTLIEFWKRFIDDVFGIWRGTENQFTVFVETLNRLAEPFGIKFGDWQIGKSVHFLDLNLEIDSENQIQYRLFRKETDAMLYLRTESFHPKHVFESVAFSQMIRIMERNSLDHTRVENIQELKKDLQKCGHNNTTLDEIEPKAVTRVLENMSRPPRDAQPCSKQQSLVFSLKFSPDNTQLKKVVKELESDIKRICGDIRIVFATRKHPSIGNKVFRNKQLGNPTPQSLQRSSQQCNSRSCKTCPLLFQSTENITVNGLNVKLEKNASCKDKNVIYIAQCQICSREAGAEDTYLAKP